MTTSVDFWIDPTCDWAWVTARWLEEVQIIRDIDVSWRVMSLAILEEGAEAEGGPSDSAAWKSVRSVEAARAHSGEEAARQLLFAIGRLTNVEGNQNVSDVIAQAVAECGLPSSIADASETPEFDAAVRASHEAAMLLGGEGVGTPIIGIPGPGGERVGYFGPVLTSTPRGEAAGRLWDGLLILAANPGFYELKKERQAKVECD
ncbi:MAG: disulfide bond formation protein DsbA [Actinomycetota bacterium]|nr:disulfide bond formation protein DsbA [Actinomycetota bacterium]